MAEMTSPIEFVPSNISLNTDILRLLEGIAKKQGELSVIQRNVQIDISLESVAAIDAVHFSTKIEGNSLSRDQVTKALETKKLRPKNRDIQEILNYSKARKLAREWALSAKPYDDLWVLSHHKQILEGIVKGKLKGHYREAQCVIQDSKTRSIVYMAPEWKDVPLLMKGLLAWLRRQIVSGANPLLLAAQFHFEFVTIHPFMDGNGRLARLLTNGILLRGGYDLERFAALEKQHENTRQEYYRALRSHQFGNYYEIPSRQDISAWITYWLECVLGAYDEGLSRISGSGLLLHGGTSFTDSSTRLEKAISLFRRHTKLRASEYCDLMNLGRTQAVADLNALLKSGHIEKVGGGRSTVYRVVKLTGE